MQRNQRSNCQHLLDHRKRKGISEKKKKNTSASLTMLKPLTVWITTNCGKFFKRWEYQTSLLVSWETCMQDKKQQFELDLKQQTGSKLGKEYIKAVYCHPAYLTDMQSTSWKCWAGWITSWNQDCWKKYQPQICRCTPVAESEENLKSLDEGEGREWKSWLKTQHSKN